MNASIPEAAPAAEIRIKDKRQRIAVKDADGVHLLGEIVFNPDDTGAYKKFVDLAQRLYSAARQLDDVKFDTAALDKDLESVEDMESALETFQSMSRAFTVTDEIWQQTCAGLDELFGAGITQIFTQGQADPELLTPLFDAVTPYYQKVRRNKIDQYTV